VGFDRGCTYRVHLPLNGKVDTLSDNFLADSFTPDGDAMLGIVVDSGQVDLARLPLDGSAPSLLRHRPFDQIWAALSPQGRWLAYYSGEAGIGHWELFVESFPVPAIRHNVAIAGEEPLWSFPGDRLFYRLRDTWYVVSVDPRTGETGRPTKVIAGSFVNILGYSYDVARDGRLLVIVGPPEETASHIRVIGNFGAELRRAQSRR